MGLSGRDERWRWVVCDLHRRWLDAGDTEAQHITMPDGEALPLDVRPRGRLKEVKGRAVYDRITELRQLHGGRDWVRFECAQECKLGSRCHGESIRRHWYRQQQIGRGANEAADAGE